MSAIATSQLNRPAQRAPRFYETATGKKVVMAVTGVILFGYVIAHLVGNLQVFEGPDAINSYAHFLHSHEGALWGARLILGAAVILHIVSAVQLWVLNNKARPVSYVKKQDVPTSYAARTMRWSGVIIAAFVVFHVLHLTTGDIVQLYPEQGMNSPDAYDNVVTGFQHPAIAISYIIALTLLTMHLYHGLWSMFQSLGISHPRYTPRIKKAAAILAIAIGIGYISIPVAALAHWINPTNERVDLGKVDKAYAARR